MTKIIIACNKKPLAAFMETELVSCGLDCRIAGDRAQLQALVAEFKPEVLFFDAAFSSAAESSALIVELQGADPQLPMVGVFEPFAENQDEIKQLFPPENILILPFAGDALQQALKQVTGLDIIKKTIEQVMDEEKEMSESSAVPVEKIELTEIIEEGLPLDEIPGLDDGKASEFFLEPGSTQEETLETDYEAESGSKVESELEADFIDDLDGDDFGNTLDDLDSGMIESGSAVFDGEKVEDAGSDLADEEGSEVPPEGDIVLEDAGAKDSSEFVAGDVDALLSDDDFTEVEIPEKPESNDPVLAELKSAGLRAEDELEASLEDFVGQEADEADVDFTEMTIPELITEPDGAAVSELDSEPASSKAEIELPEDYLVDEEIFGFRAEAEPESEIELEPEKEPEVEGHAIAPAPSSTPKTEEPEICPEPHVPDFSRQIENMTQEWSKQLLQSTYASMDKMIKAIGDLAPTIVDQVAREIIPPLAEKVIKAEIARLEKTLEIEEEQEEHTDT